MVYLNHAATTYPKPETVRESVMAALSGPPGSQYRSAADAEGGRDVPGECRNRLAQLFGIPAPDRIYFTGGSTQALNMAILGLRKRLRRLVITAAEHNAVLRTVYDGLREELGDGRLKLEVIPCDKSGYVDMGLLEKAITPETDLVIVNHSSNVTGAVQDISRIGEWTARAGAYFLVDASQSAGALPVDVQSMHIDLLAFTAHKGLYGIQGCGGLYVREDIPLIPIMYGGTGSDSRTMIPDKPFYEVGTANLPGIAGLDAGVRWVLDTGLNTIMEKESRLMKLLYEGLKNCPGVTVYADRQPEGTALSFTLKGLSPSDLGYILSGTYGIVVRTGLHCAPLIHRYLGTEKEGTVRVSISYLTTEEDILYFLRSIEKLSLEMGAILPKS